MENLLTSILTGNIGTVALILILWKSGLLRYLLNKNGKENDMSETMTKLEQHYNHETTEILNRIDDKLGDNNDKLDKILENTIYLKARLNGKSN